MGGLPVEGPEGLDRDGADGSRGESGVDDRANADVGGAVSHRGQGRDLRGGRGKGVLSWDGVVIGQGENV